MDIPVLLAISYAALAALLLALNMATPWRRSIKFAAIILVSALYVGTYIAAQELRGWAVKAEPPTPFKLHWAVVEEPDKAQDENKNGEGAIYILAQKISPLGAHLGVPRLYHLPFSPTLAEQVADALRQIESGTAVQGTFTNRAIRPSQTDELREGEQRDLDNARGEDAAQFEFRALAKPILPPKR